jgi:hypothetical protein
MFVIIEGDVIHAYLGYTVPFVFEENLWALQH